EELARIGRQALDIAALALGIDGVEGERRLAGAGQAGHHDQPVARQVEVYVLEVVLARAANGDELVVRHDLCAASGSESIGSESRAQHAGQAPYGDRAVSLPDPTGPNVPARRDGISLGTAFRALRRQRQAKRTE